MSLPNDLSRRTFLKSSATAAALTAFGAPAVLASRAPSETLNVGCIGTGGRCQTLMKSLVKVPNVRIVAVCDIYDAHLDAARKLADPKAVGTKIYKDILDNKDIDAVLIGAPDHWHTPMAIDALAAGKDVYVEKPVTHTLEEGKALLEAQGKSKRIVQVGMQQRSMPHIEKARELIRSGRIGKVYKVHLTWNRNVDRVQKTPLNIDPKTVDWKAFLGDAPEQPFDEYRFRNWRWFWDFGGGVFTDLGVHWIDVAHWLLDLDHPLQASAIGANFISKGVWQTPDTAQTMLTYPNDLQVYFEATFVNARNAAMIEFMGSDATLNIDRGGYQIFPERDKGEFEEMILGTDKKRGRDFYDKPDGELLHLTNWVECVRSGKTPNAPVQAGVNAAAAAHLANQALRSNQVAMWKE
jgi:predicted dehydrogenase